LTYQPDERNEGLIKMAKITYTTRTLAEVLIDNADDNIKQATRTLRKFLRDELGEGKAVVGKGGRYALEYGAPEIRTLKKKFAAWEVAQAEAKAARAEALEAAKTVTAQETLPIEDDTDDEAETDIEDEGDNTDDEANGPTDEEIAEMLSDEDEAADEV
jgi:hypothetical protein